MSTIIRHKNTSPATIAVVSTDFDDCYGFTARLQRYIVNENGSTSLVSNEAYSSESAAIALFDKL